tara:strand:- start:2586 stop:2972 length:387 start_codon:yes stop_codon:yes gene_type:complete
MFYISYGIHNIPWGEKNFYDLIYKLKYFLKIPSECLVISVIYMKRLVVNGLEITEFNIRNILVTCILLSHKFLIDEIIPIIFYSSVINIPIKYIVKMELYIIKLLNYKLFIDTILYHHTENIITENLY